MKGQLYRITEAILLTLFSLYNLFTLERNKCPIYSCVNERTDIKKSEVTCAKPTTC